MAPSFLSSTLTSFPICDEVTTVMNTNARHCTVTMITITINTYAGHCIINYNCKLKSINLLIVKNILYRVILQMEVIVGDFGIVVVPRDGADTERIMNHSSVLRKHKVTCYKGYLNHQSFKYLDLLEYYLCYLHNIIYCHWCSAEAN